MLGIKTLETFGAILILSMPFIYSPCINRGTFMLHLLGKLRTFWLDTGRLKWFIPLEKLMLVQTIWPRLALALLLASTLSSSSLRHAVVAGC